MSIIAAFTGAYCGEEDVLKEIAQRTGFKHLTDADIVARASSLSGLSEARLLKAFNSRTPVFNQLTHEKEISVAYLKQALAETLRDDKILISGLTSLLIPSSIADVLRICVTSDMKSRSLKALDSGLSERKALKTIQDDDNNRMAWTRAVLGNDNPWDSSMYDMVLPTDKMTSTEIADQISEAISKVNYMRTLYSQKVIEDFALASRVDVALVKSGHYCIGTEADGGAVTLTINKNVIMLKRLENHLQYEARKISGVSSVTTKVGPDFYQADIVRKYDLIPPSRPFRVRDEYRIAPALFERATQRDNRLYKRP